jgi:hypothetical protein
MSSTFGGSTHLTLPFSRSGQCRTDHDVDPMVREDPKVSSDLWLVLLRDRVSGSGFNGGTDPMVTVKETCQMSVNLTGNHTNRFPSVGFEGCKVITSWSSDSQSSEAKIA